MPPVRISAVVFPALSRSRTSIIVRSSIQMVSCISIGRGMSSTSTRGCWFTEAVGRCGGAGACATAVLERVASVSAVKENIPIVVMAFIERL